MTYFADLAQCGYFHASMSNLIAVGWLDTNHAFPKGEVSAEVRGLLWSFASRTWQPRVYCGSHFCEFCPGNLTASICISGSTNLFVPSSSSLLYVAPELIAHYVDTHQYLPPEQFIDALTVCSRMSDAEYQEALVRVGAPLLLR